jgi:hypothetical protein
MAKQADDAKLVDPTDDSDAPSLRQVLRRAHEEGKLFIFRSKFEGRSDNNNFRCVVVGEGKAPLIQIEPDRETMDPLIRVMKMPHPLQDPIIALPEELLSLEDARILKAKEARAKQRKWLFWALGVWAAMLIGMYLIHINGEMRAACREQAARTAATAPATFWKPCGKIGS